MSGIPIEQLTPSERLTLIGELWDSLDPADVPVTQAQKDELDRRRDAATSETGKSWEELEASLRRR